MTLTVLVVYATAEGSTEEIAQFVGRLLSRRHAHVEVRSVLDMPDPGQWDAVVLGSAIHGMTWLPAAQEYVRQFLPALEHKDDLWLFSVGLGPSLRGPLGRRMARATPKPIAVLIDSVRPREHREFAGVFDRKHTNLVTRALYRAIGGGRRYGDLRQWERIEEYAVDIAAALHLPDDHPK